MTRFAQRTTTLCAVAALSAAAIGAGTALTLPRLAHAADASPSAVVATPTSPPALNADICVSRHAVCAAGAVV